MKAAVLGAIAIVSLVSSADAQTYNAGGFTIHVPQGCKSASCVSVDSAEYGVHHRGTAVKSRKNGAAVAKRDDAAGTNAAAPTTSAATQPAATSSSPASTAATATTAAAPSTPSAPPAAAAPAAPAPASPAPVTSSTQTN